LSALTALTTRFNHTIQPCLLSRPGSTAPDWQQAPEVVITAEAEFLIFLLIFAWVFYNSAVLMLMQTAANSLCSLNRKIHTTIFLKVINGTNNKVKGN